MDWKAGDRFEDETGEPKTVDVVMGNVIYFRTPGGLPATDASVCGD